MTIGIYKLLFKDGSFYIGKSIDIERRFAAHLYTLKNNTSSRKLQKAYTVQGRPLLEVILECTEEELDEAEKEAIEIFDAINLGLNASAGGTYSYSKDGKNCYLLSENVDVYRSILKALITNTTCKEIATTLGVSIDIVLQISSLKSHSWLAEDMPIEYSALEQINSIGRKNYFSKLVNVVLVSPDKKKTNIPNLREYCKGDTLMYTGLYRVITGEKNSWHGWKLPTTIDKVYPILLSPSLEEFHISYGKAKEFALIHDMNPSSLTRLLSGKVPHYKNWTIKNAKSDDNGNSDS